jgi:SAM-dependent methyltransferase
MHPYRFAPDVIVGAFKPHGVPATACVPGSDPDLIAAMQSAYDDHLAGDPTWKVRALDERIGLNGNSCLDIACATGGYSFQLADHGAEVLGVEIRPEQVEQASFIRDAEASGRFDRTRFEHDPTSADSIDFRSGEAYDVVLSMGLLYHLSDPLQHLANIRRLTRRAAVVHTLTHANDRGYWLLLREDRGEITKAWEGVSWTPHCLDVPDLLRDVGFDHVEVLATPQLARLQRHDRRGSRTARLALPGALIAGTRRIRDRRYLQEFEAARLRGQHARYYTYLAT